MGSRAYGNAARNPDSAAILFKRLMGTSTPIMLAGRQYHDDAGGLLCRDPAVPCSDTFPRRFAIAHAGTVITVPAAFNQMQKDATMAAADAAHIGRVALMQEPVAAVMSVMRARGTDGMFLVYDLGGGTLDIAIAEGIAGRVSLVAHGGIAMCGGRDFDRALFAQVAKPWLLERFDLPADFETHPQFKKLVRMAEWASEKAKIELSQREDSIITLSESELGMRDLAGSELYLDIPLDRRQLDGLIADKVGESVAAATGNPHESRTDGRRRGAHCVRRWTNAVQATQRPGRFGTGNCAVDRCESHDRRRRRGRGLRGVHRLDVAGPGPQERARHACRHEQARAQPPLPCSNPGSQDSRSWLNSPVRRPRGLRSRSTTSTPAGHPAAWHLRTG